MRKTAWTGSPRQVSLQRFPLSSSLLLTSYSSLTHCLCLGVIALTMTNVVLCHFYLYHLVYMSFKSLFYLDQPHKSLFFSHILCVIYRTDALIQQRYFVCMSSVSLLPPVCVRVTMMSQSSIVPQQWFTRNFKNPTSHTVLECDTEIHLKNIYQQKEHLCLSGLLLLKK